MSVTFEKVLVLKNVPLFSGASEGALADLIAVSHEHTLKAGDYLLESEEKNIHLYVVLSGLLEIKSGKMVMGEVGPRQIFGETTVFSPAALGVDVIAKETTKVLCVGAEPLQRMMMLHTSLMNALLEELSKRLRLAQMKK